ncbi:uncharacterized protein LOC119554669 [Drosophila subpulchrella]|uniref:uncharacterized protein LOC119554669 n=1 Tax=Drosophila subpulchrella TaxID=1486046 RepID=UPI0018A1B329|nr:uncharacterized protein LOC119554669 [Drosophila subpulchrella]
MAEAGENRGARRTAREVQQDFAVSLGYAEEIIWDLLSQEQAHVLNQKLRELIRDPPQPTAEELANRSRAENEKEAKSRTKLIADNKKARQTIFDAVWEQRKYTNRQSLTALIYVMVVTDQMDVNRAEDSRTFSCHPVFRARRCITGNSGRSSDSSDCCNLFIDETGRVYQNWEQYVATNELPEGVMVAPEKGVYRLGNHGVRLDKYVTPAGSPNTKVLGYLDTGSAIGGFAAACVPLAALLTLPVSAPLMAVAGVVGLASAGYATARSGARLVDRSQHEQSINVTNREARGHWMGVAAGTVGLGAAGATTALTAATNAGREVGAITQLTVNGMNISSIVVSGTGVANGVLDLILKVQDGDDITGMDVLQLSASLVLLTHSVYNFKLASTIITDTANKNIAGYRDTLSNRQRRSFDKMSKETVRLRGTTRGKLDIIRNVNEMPSRQQFNDLYKINQNLNQEGVRYSFAPDGQGILLNGEVQTTAADLRASVQHNQGANVLGQVTQQIPASHGESGRLQLGGPNQASRLIGPLPTSRPRQEPSTYAAGVFTLQLSSVVVGGVTFALERYGQIIFDHIINAESFENLINGMADNLEPAVFDFVMKLTRTFMDTMLEDLNIVLKFFISTESVLFRILQQVMNQYRNMPYSVVEEHTGDIIRAVKVYFLSLNPNSYTGLLQKCTTCAGYFSICPL